MASAPALPERLGRHARAKDRIAAKLVTLVGDGGAIGIDASTTLQRLARSDRRRVRDLTVLTTVPTVRCSAGPPRRDAPAHRWSPRRPHGEPRRTALGPGRPRLHPTSALRVGGRGRSGGRDLRVDPRGRRRQAGLRRGEHPDRPGRRLVEARQAVSRSLPAVGRSSSSSPSSIPPTSTSTPTATWSTCADARIRRQPCPANVRSCTFCHNRTDCAAVLRGSPSRVRHRTAPGARADDRLRRHRRRARTGKRSSCRRGRSATRAPGSRCSPSRACPAIPSRRSPTRRRCTGCTGPRAVGRAAHPVGLGRRLRQAPAPRRGPRRPARHDQHEHVPGRRLQARAASPTSTSGSGPRRSPTCSSASTSWT